MTLRIIPVNESRGCALSCLRLSRWYEKCAMSVTGLGSNSGGVK